MENNLRTDFQKIIIDSLNRLYPQFDEDLINSLDMPLTGEPFFFTAEMLLYLYAELEESLQITFTENDVINYEFNSINRIAETIKRHLSAPTTSSKLGVDK